VDHNVSVYVYRTGREKRSVERRPPRGKEGREKVEKIAAGGGRGGKGKIKVSHLANFPRSRARGKGGEGERRGGKGKEGLYWGERYRERYSPRR